ncbi:hypothetical protein L596_007742 [Steinernema carpocapsae]|uniref:Methyltransferase type 11 domain-containing protein n=1 Tax=Steinernema carpocapsae TaxID=34508 RepID=A0A4U5PAC7_STECR|nr:hypothetical protein L596_007742 [Steinernema carpocapsae]
MESKLQYKENSYWNKRFASEAHFEWLADWKKFQRLILPRLSKSDRILHIGCGNSRLSHELFEAGFTDVTNVDFSEILIENGKQRYPEMKWVCNDMRTLHSIPSGSMDVVVEKASIESLLVAERSQWDPSDQAISDVDAILRSVQRVLKHDGIFISISFTQPHFRIPAIIRNPGWSCTVETFGDYFHYYCYVMKMGESPDLNELGKYSSILQNNNYVTSSVTLPEDSEDWLQGIDFEEF